LQKKLWSSTRQSLSGEATTLDSDLKRQVAKEAATLLYFGAEKEFKQAKVRAAKILGSHFLPSNLEVALALDTIAEAQEGSKRKERLILMRQDALEIMKHLSLFCPVLVGSVWRGTVRQGSDIDIAVYTDEPERIATLLKSEGVKVLKTDWTTVNKHGATLDTLHVYAVTQNSNEIEIVVRNKEQIYKKSKCEIFGDQIRGLNVKELEKILKTNPAKQFIPA
jgi:predicted nucleotidyltransferase